jgi:hypothetical protein
MCSPTSFTHEGKAPHDAYAFIFDQQGVMAGVSIEGTKISRIKL